ncbi:MAG: hypothetical protein U0667_08635 [Chloroflexota bacterium]
MDMVQAEPRRVVAGELLVVTAAVTWLLARAEAPGGIETMRLGGSLPAVTTVSLGSAVAGLGALLGGRPVGRPAGLALVGLAVVLAAGHRRQHPAVNAAMQALALVCAWVGWHPSERAGRAPAIGRRGVLVGLAAGALVVSAGAGVAMLDERLGTARRIRARLRDATGGPA